MQCDAKRLCANFMSIPLFEQYGIALCLLLAMKGFDGLLACNVSVRQSSSALAALTGGQHPDSGSLVGHRYERLLFYFFSR